MRFITHPAKANSLIKTELCPKFGSVAIFGSVNKLKKLYVPTKFFDSGLDMLWYSDLEKLMWTLKGDEEEEQEQISVTTDFSPGLYFSLKSPKLF